MSRYKMLQRASEEKNEPRPCVDGAVVWVIRYER